MGVANIANMAIRVSTQNGEMEHVLQKKTDSNVGKTCLKPRKERVNIVSSILPRNVKKNRGREAPYGCPD